MRAFVLGGVSGVLALIAGLGSADAQQKLTADEIRTLVVGKEFQISTNAIVTYKTDGSYMVLLLNGGGRQRGIYRVEEGRICVDFHNGYKRCDQILRDDGGRYYFNSRNKYPMTPR